MAFSLVPYVIYGAGGAFEAKGEASMISGIWGIATAGTAVAWMNYDGNWSVAMRVPGRTTTSG
jgi:hypothetical protein